MPAGAKTFQGRHSQEKQDRQEPLLCFFLFLGCRLYTSSTELAPQGSLQLESKAPALVEFYIEPDSQKLFKNGTYLLRMIQLDERGKEAHAEKFQISQGYKMLLLEPGGLRTSQGP